ncbi:HTH domain-containing protein [Paenibacillus peoriae]|uniref:BglG family transcription antiterminator n=1 Tax=Paenibacillus peoriae TaxID=59893 RepID=UPI00026C6797|nr:PRD domain-containing protein [Paenibacillus peoriae]MEC0180891.1 HTH domain-containing protein [Paenibacillus peoriae]
MVRRHRDILNCILNTEGFINGSILARMCGVSIRTIQHDIKVINSMLEDYGIKIDSVLIKGYYLNEKSKEIVKEKNIIRKVLDAEYINEIPNTPFERQMYIILMLTVKNYMSVGELADELYVSESSINKDIIATSLWLRENVKINLDYSLSKGVGLEATEKVKRNIISWVLSNKLNASILEKYWKYLFGSINFFVDRTIIYKIIEFETKRFGYFLSGHSFQLFALEISIALARSAAGFTLEDPCGAESGLRPILLSLRKSFEETMNFRLSTNDWLILQEYFLSKQFLSGTSVELIATKEAASVVEEFLIILQQKYHIHFAEHSLIKEKLILYISPMINRLKYNHCIGNKLNEDIGLIHPLESKMVSEISDIVDHKINLTVPAVEMGYIAIHLAAVYKLWSHKLQAIIVCDYDESILCYIKNKIASLVDDQVKLVGCYTFLQLISGEIESLQDVDLIITTSTLAGRTNIPFIQINPLMSRKDIKSLLDSIHALSQKIQ